MKRLRLLLVSIFVMAQGCKPRPVSFVKDDGTDGQDPYAFSENEMYGWIQTQMNFGERHPGSAALEKNEDFIEQQFRSFGLENVRREPVHDMAFLPPQIPTTTAPARQENKDAPVETWEADLQNSHLQIEGSDMQLDTYPVPHTKFTDQRGVTAALTYVEPGISYGQKLNNMVYEPTWTDKIVVAEITFPPIPVWLFKQLSLQVYDPYNMVSQMNHPATWVYQGWENYKLAMDSGAAGFIGILKDQPGGEYRLYGPYGFKERDILDKRIPAMWASGDKTKSQALIDAAKMGQLANLTVVGKRGNTKAYNIIGEIPGASPNAEAVVITSHMDSPFLSPVEDASGMSEVLGLAKHFAAKHRAGVGLKRRLIFIGTYGHFYGSVGTRSFIADHPELTVAQNGAAHPKVALEMTIEHVAREAVATSDGKGIQPVPYVTGYASDPSNVPPELSGLARPETGVIFLSFNNALLNAVGTSVEAFNLDRTVLFGAEGPLGPFPPTDGGDWYRYGIPTVNYISNPAYLLTKQGDDMNWVAKERLPKLARVFSNAIELLDKVPADSLYAHDMPAKEATVKAAGWLNSHL